MVLMTSSLCMPLWYHAVSLMSLQANILYWVSHDNKALLLPR